MSRGAGVHVCSLFPLRRPSRVALSLVAKRDKLYATQYEWRARDSGGGMWERRKAVNYQFPVPPFAPASVGSIFQAFVCVWLWLPR